MHERQKAARYDMTHPGVDIPTEQKAERYDRKAVKEKYAGRTRRRGGATVGSITVPNNFGCDTCRQVPWKCQCAKENSNG